MKLTIRRVFLGILIGFSFTGVATATQVIPAGKTVYRIHTYDGYAVLRFSPATTSTEGCGGGALADTTVVIDWSTSAGYKLHYAAVLAAQVNGKLMGFAVNGCHPWGGGVPIVYRIDIDQ